jgi:hypothetical protein
MKPLNKLSEREFSQQLTIKMVKPPEFLTIGTISSNSNLRFALPVLFISFLRNGEVG